MEVKFDQHFLNAKNVLLLEKNLSEINNEDIIFEIGPGDGRLSEFLLQGKPKKLISVEMDEKLMFNLDNLKNKYKNFEYVIGNGLDLISKYKFNKLVSNIPYSITEPLYKKILDIKIPFVVLLHGIGFYEKMCDENSKWSYLVDAFYDIDLLKEVPGNAFEPPANTMSVLVKLTSKEKLSDFDKFIQILYSKRDRTLKNALLFSYVDFFNISKRDAKEKINFKIPDKKLMNLSNVEFVDFIYKIKF